MQKPEEFVDRFAVEVGTGVVSYGVLVSRVVARDAEWQARVERLEAALNSINLNGHQTYCTDECLCAARDMRLIARAALAESAVRKECPPHCKGE